MRPMAAPIPRHTSKMTASCRSASEASSGRVIGSRNVGVQSDFIVESVRQTIRHTDHAGLATMPAGGYARMRLSYAVLSIVLSVLIAAPQLQAQTHTANQAALDAVVQ